MPYSLSAVGQSRRPYSLAARRALAAALLAGLAVLSGPAAASLTTFKAWTGDVGLSMDGWGHSDVRGGDNDPINGGPGSDCNFADSGDCPVPGIFFSIPTGATVLAAYFYTATEETQPDLGTVTLGNLDVSAWDATYSNRKSSTGGTGASETFFNMGREDVTSLVQGVVADPTPSWVTKTTGGGMDFYELFIAEPSAPRCPIPGGIIFGDECTADFVNFVPVVNDVHSGEALAVVYQHESAGNNVVVLLDGSEQGVAADPDGDSATVDFTNIDVEGVGAGQSLDIDASAGALLSLGVTFGSEIVSGTIQASDIEVGPGATEPLTQRAGGNDDNVDRGKIVYGGTGSSGEGGANGEANLITVGGVFDTPLVCDPAEGTPCGIGDTLSDNPELYEISKYFSSAATQIVIENFNESGDDNLFLAGLVVALETDGNGPGPEDPVPAPATLLLAALGLAVAPFARRRRAARKST